jgi:hypothetical protein
MIGAQWLVGSAYQGLGRLELGAASRDPARMIDEHAQQRLAEYMDNSTCCGAPATRSPLPAP